MHQLCSNYSAISSHSTALPAGFTHFGARKTRLLERCSGYRRASGDVYERIPLLFPGKAKKRAGELKPRSELLSVATGLSESASQRVFDQTGKMLDIQAPAPTMIPCEYCGKQIDKRSLKQHQAFECPDSETRVMQVFFLFLCVRTIRQSYV
jgi:hypothetical protein